LLENNPDGQYENKGSISGFACKRAREIFGKVLTKSFGQLFTTPSVKLIN